MIEKINNNQVPDILKESPAIQPVSTKDSEKTSPDASLQVSYDSLIEQAQQPPQEDADVVQQARRLIASGQLETPENIRAAAEKIAEFGI